MIYCTLKTLNIKPELRNEFEKWINEFISSAKKEGLNLSYDGGWQKENIFVIMERWSDESSCRSYYSKKENKERYSKINDFLTKPVSYFGYKTIN